MERLRELELDCISLIIRKMSGELNPKQYCDALMGLNLKYPIKEHEPPLTQFQLKHYKRIKQVHKDPDSGILYSDHLQPWNFDEGGQMYYWHSKDYIETEKEFKSQLEIDGKMASAHDYPEEWDE